MAYARATKRYLTGSLPGRHPPTYPNMMLEIKAFPANLTILDVQQRLRTMGMPLTRSQVYYYCVTKGWYAFPRKIPSGRPVGAFDKTPRKKRTDNLISGKISGSES